MSSTISKARCPDQISGRMLRFTAASIDTAVTKLFNQSISNFCTSFVPCTIHNWNTFSSHGLLACFSVKTNFWAYMQN